MQKFRKKRELLEYLGKNPNDNKLVDRMLLRGEVHMENGMYIYESKEMVLQQEVDELKKENKNLKENSGSISKDEVEWLQSDLEYLNGEYEKLERTLNRSLRKCYDFMLQKKLFTEDGTPYENFFNWAIK